MENVSNQNSKLNTEIVEKCYSITVGIWREELTCIKYIIRVFWLKGFQCVQCVFTFKFEMLKNGRQSGLLMKLYAQEKWVDTVNRMIEVKWIELVGEYRSWPLWWLKHKDDLFYVFSVLPHILVNFMRWLMIHSIHHKTLTCRTMHNSYYIISYD